MPRKLSLYSDFQKSLLREGLFNSKKRYEQMHGRAITWIDFNSDVSEGARVLIERNPKSLRKNKYKVDEIEVKINKHFISFAKSDLVKNSRKPERKNRAYGDLPDYQLLAIELWLTDPENTLSELTREIMNGGSHPPNIAYEFTSFLFDGADQKPMISVDGFYPEYIAKKDLTNHWKEKGKKKEVVELSIENNYKNFLGVKIQYFKILDTSDSNNDKNEYARQSTDSYIGWLTISPEDEVFIFSKNENEPENKIFIVTGLNVSALSFGEKINCLAVVESPNPVYFETLAIAEKKSQSMALENASRALFFKENK